MNNENDEQENYSSQTEKPKSEESLLILIEKLKLIKEEQEKGKGKIAWTIGKMLSELKQQRSEKVKKPDLLANFESFDYYVLKTFALSKLQTENYIKIFNGIKASHLITKKMAISHLEEVIVLKDKKAIEELLKTLGEMELEMEKEKENKNGKYSVPYNRQIIASIVSQYENYLQKQSNNKKSNDNLSLFSDDSSESNKNQEAIKINFHFREALNTEISDHERRSEQIKKQRSDIWGQDIKTSYFPEIENIYSREPIDEQGLVGLFCTIFPIIKSKNLTIKCLDYLNFLEIPKKYQYQLNFKKIKGIRTRFPDAIIELDIYDFQLKIIRTTELFIEFEFESFNYVDHKHYDSKEKCHLIVCWKHEELSKWEYWKNNSYNKSKPLPFILSVENLLETGEINLINLNKS